jgi:hypothetical protein
VAWQICSNDKNATPQFAAKQHKNSKDSAELFVHCGVCMELLLIKYGVVAVFLAAMLEADATRAGGSGGAPRLLQPGCCTRGRQLRSARR